MQSHTRHATLGWGRRIEYGNKWLTQQTIMEGCSEAGAIRELMLVVLVEVVNALVVVVTVSVPYHRSEI